MKGKIAASYFHGPERYNCSQAVLKAYQDEYSISESHIEGYKMYGGGRAEQGLCGALYAVINLAEDKALQERIKIQFCDLTGSQLCKEIRRDGTIDCRQCVECAARLLEKNKKAG